MDINRARQRPLNRFPQCHRQHILDFAANDFVARLDRFRVTSYLNNAMPESEAEMLGVFSQDTMRRLRALKERHGAGNLFRMGPWEYSAHQ